MSEHATTEPGYVNGNGQRHDGVLGDARTDGEAIHRMSCGNCGAVYAALRGEIALRKCPGCQGGAPGALGWTAEPGAAPEEPPRVSCEKCGGTMECGHLVDATQTRERKMDWVRGSPKAGFFSMKLRTSEGDRLKVDTLRCTACGFLESYALEVKKEWED